MNRRTLCDWCRVFSLAVMWAFALLTSAKSEVVFQDFFSQPATNITNSVPWIDVEGKGWQCGAATSQLALDGVGHLYNSASNAGATAGVQLIPIGPHGSMTASAIVQLPKGFNE